MGKSAVFVIGPAGAGKSTFCSTLIRYYEDRKRTVHLVNLDPAAEHFTYEPSIDIRNLVNLQDVMDECDLGPNGGLLFCFEYLMENLDWLENELGDYADDFIIIDCPGQIELYTHVPVMKSLIEVFQQRFQYRVCTSYLLDAPFLQDKSKYFSGVLCALSSMIQLECPHVNILTKVDLLMAPLENGGNEKGKQKGNRKKTPAEEADENRVYDYLERFLEVDSVSVLHDQKQPSLNAKFEGLTRTIANIVDEYSMVQLVPLNIRSEDSVQNVVMQLEMAIQLGEDEEPKEPKLHDDEDEPLETIAEEDEICE